MILCLKTIPRSLSTVQSTVNSLRIPLASRRHFRHRADDSCGQLATTGMQRNCLDAVGARALVECAFPTEDQTSSRQAVCDCPLAARHDSSTGVHTLHCFSTPLSSAITTHTRLVLVSCAWKRGIALSPPLMPSVSPRRLILRGVILALHCSLCQPYAQLADIAAKAWGPPLNLTTRETGKITMARCTHGRGRFGREVIRRHTHADDIT